MEATIHKNSSTMLCTKFSEILLELFECEEPIDIRVLFESFMIALTTQLRNNKSRSLSFAISDGDHRFTIEMEITDDGKFIHSMEIQGEIN